MLPRHRALVVGALAVLGAAPFLLLGLGAAPFDDPGEGMHAEIARELRVSGSPLDLRLNGVPYLDKPPLLYVLLTAAFRLGGENEAAARAVAAVAALAALGVTAWLGTRLLGVGCGIIAAGSLLTSVGFFAYARYVRPETLFVAALAAGFAFMLVGVTTERRVSAGLGLACFGLAGLAKDPLGALVPPIIVGTALALAGRARPLRRWLPWPGVTAWLILGLGWWTLVALRVPGFAWYAVMDNHVLNITRSRYFPDEDVPLSALAFLVVAALGAAPWIVTATMTVVALVRRRAWRDVREIPWVVLALWAVGVLVGIALSPFRLPHYGLPAYPAIALLAARGWREGSGRGLALAHAAGFAALALGALLAWAGDAVTFTERVMAVTDVATRKAAAAGHETMLPWDAFRPLLGWTAAIFAAGTLGLALVAVTRRGPAVAVAVVLATMGALLPCVAASLMTVSAQRGVKSVAQEVAARADARDLLVHEGPLENSGALEWYSGRRPVIVDGRRSVLAFGATLDGVAFWDRAQLLEAWPGERRVWMVTTRAPDHSVAADLPGARLVAAGGGRRLYVNR